MYYETPRFNSKGQPICEICEVAYDKLLLHVNRRHDLNALEYKARFQFHPRKGIQSKKLVNKMRNAVKKNYNQVVMKNLIMGGRKTRFADGNKATDTELVRSVSRERMTAYWASKKKTKQENLSDLIKKLNSIINPH